MRMQPPTDEQRARDADLTAKVKASVEAFESLPDIDKAVHRLDQKRSGIHGLSDFDSPLTKEQCDAIIDRFPEFVVLRAYRDARAEIARLTAERDEARAHAIMWAERAASEIGTADEAVGRYDALLAERAGVSEAMVEMLEDCYRQFNFYAREHEKAGKLIKAATNDKFAERIKAVLATPIPTPVDREAIRAEAVDGDAKTRDDTACSAVSSPASREASSS